MAATESQPETSRWAPTSPGPDAADSLDRGRRDHARDGATAAGERDDHRQRVRDAIAEGARFDTAFAFCNATATVIACAGLLEDSAATIIGAMLVATLMGPIMGIGLALVDFNDRLLGRSFVTLVAGAILVLGIAMLCGVAAPQIPTGSEMLSRTSPRLADLVVAFVSGAMSAYATTHRRLSAALIGVSIAVALVPPLATAGLLIVRADWRLAGGALLLTFVNVVAIQVGASVTLWARGFHGRAAGDAPRAPVRLARQVGSAALMLALAITLGVHGTRLIRRRQFESAVHDTVQSALLARPAARLNEVFFGTDDDGISNVTAVVRSPEPFTPADVAAIEGLLPRAPDGVPVRLRVRRVAVDVVGH